MNFNRNKNALARHLNNEKKLARERFSGQKIGSHDLYNLVYKTSNDNFRKVINRMFPPNVNSNSNNNNYNVKQNIKKKLNFATSVRNVHELANGFLAGRGINKSRWSRSNLSPELIAFEIKRPVPVVAYDKNGRYVGHIWREGAPPSETGTDTAKFIGIQKTLDPSVKVSRFVPTILAEVEKELGELGYKKMATFPRKVLAQMLPRMNWPEQNRNTGLVTKTIGRRFNKSKAYQVNNLIRKHGAKNMSTLTPKQAQNLVNALRAVQVNYPRKNRVIKLILNKQPSVK